MPDPTDAELSDMVKAMLSEWLKDPVRRWPRALGLSEEAGQANDARRAGGAFSQAPQGTGRKPITAATSGSARTARPFHRAFRCCRFRL
ncbi:MAG: hypothetical protein MZV70_57755 [Desulfobacterales bacterium]|nr:hypothetical protein [Desulfobacterales bacterium]